MKYESYDAEKNGGQSLPSRERGLKSTGIDAYKNVRSVAPFAGAWIEITHSFRRSTAKSVAPFAGAWIEIVSSGSGKFAEVSLPSRERGLKLCQAVLASLQKCRSLRGSVD